MKRVLLFLLLATCGGDNKPEKKRRPTKPVPVAVADAGKQASPCALAFAKAWPLVKPNLMRLEPSLSEEDLERWYQGSVDLLAGKCETLPPDRIACLVAAAHPIEGIHACGVRDKLPIPTLAIDKIGVVPRLALSPEESRERLADLAGKWMTETPQLRVTWTITPQGIVSERREVTGKPPQDRRFSIAFRQEGRVAVKWNPSSTQDLVFLREGDRMWVQGNLNHDTFPVADWGKLVARIDVEDHLFLEGDRCEVISAAGLAATTECRLDETALHYKVAFPQQTWANGKPKVLEGKLLRVGNSLLSERMAETSEMRRVP
jgi:hypothetical protein